MDKGLEAMSKRDLAKKDLAKIKRVLRRREKE